ncbi:MAG: NnrU family protein [Alphaproteobacteria bacterium]|jgi:uncharacterized membrane protein|nr:NnrU family protein [Alphaproteobacteria bacterium]
MYGTLQYLLAAMFVFIAGHVILASLPVRQGLIKALGEKGFRVLFSVFALATLVWVIHAYGVAPRTEIWPADPALRHVPLLVMPLACILLVAGLTTRSMTMVGGETMDAAPATGILTITRHPFLWAVALWGLVHALANGDHASLVLFLGMALLAFLGMVHIDHRRERQLGAAWGPMALTTSVIPFQAAIQGRCKLDWAGIGWPRTLGGLALYAALLLAHQWIAGVALLPG